MEEEQAKTNILNTFICTLLIALFLLPCFNLKAEGFSFKKDNKNIRVEKSKKSESFFDKIIFFRKNKKKSEDSSNLQTKEQDAVNTKSASIVFSLEDCINFALKNDPNIKIYENTQKAQKSLVGQAKSNYFPSLVGGTGYNIVNTRYSGNRSETINGNYYGVDAGVNQLIWDFGKTRAKINMNKYNYEASGYDLDNAILDTVLNVKIAYTAVLASRANEDIYSRSVKINELNVDRTKAMYEVGLKSKIDLVNAQATLTEAEIELLQAQNSYQTALVELNNSMYFVDAPEYTIKDTETFNFQKNYSAKNEIDVSYKRDEYKKDETKNIDDEMKEVALLTSGIEKRDIIKDYQFKPFTTSMSDAIKTAYDKRPDLKSLVLVQKASEEALKAIKRSYFPELNASGGYSFQKQSDLSTSGFSVYAGVDLPNVNAMDIKYQIDEGKAYLEIAKNNIDALQKGIYFEVQSYYIDMKQLEKRIPLMSQRIEQALENFELADGRYGVGLGNYLELQQALTDYNNAQLAFVQSVFDYNKARFYLEKAMAVR